ncbi:hypothetical protein [Enterococcus hulanensis]|uniref:hypothetical protein n=1 Tax=Enterococcus hulanensis TaxID=2559929 RepID=UPI0028BE24D3|nr:hypothetical protein [Enterococcus hulanensis]
MIEIRKETKERLKYTDEYIKNGGTLGELFDDETFQDLVNKEIVSSIQPGDKVRYIGTSSPDHTGKILEVKTIVNAGLILLFPIEDRSLVALEGAGIWKSESLLCGFEDIEKLR